MLILKYARKRTVRFLLPKCYLTLTPCLKEYSPKVLRNACL